ncbi:MAG: helix-turn-helix transcriptional regulator [Planctomycetaceae bacterium]|nr:helix-turn-helix transcriptional regulator [Planctomycetaceae bacterium]
MSIAPDNLSAATVVPDYRHASESAANELKNEGLHRIQEVREQQGISLRSVARQMKRPISTVREQERSDSDLKLSELLQWQNILDVPLVDLLHDLDSPLSRPVMERAQMVKLMKTAASIAEQAECDGVQRLAKMLTDQLVNMMPELSEVSAWHSVGQRRSLNEYGRVVDRRLGDDFFSAFRDE